MPEETDERPRGPDAASNPLFYQLAQSGEIKPSHREWFYRQNESARLSLTSASRAKLPRLAQQIGSGVRSAWPGGIGIHAEQEAN
jgi:hypothetical protein